MTSHYLIKDAEDAQFLEMKKLLPAKETCTSEHADKLIHMQHLFYDNTQKVSTGYMEVVKQILTLLWLGSRKVE